MVGKKKYSVLNREDPVNLTTFRSHAITYIHMSTPHAEAKSIRDTYCTTHSQIDLSGVAYHTCCQYQSIPVYPKTKAEGERIGSLA